MAISTYPVTLNYDSGTSTPIWTKLSDIKDFPDLGGAPEMLDATSLSDASRVYIAGVKDQQALEFTANYDEEAFDLIVTLTGQQDFQLWFGTSGASGKFNFSGTVSVYISGGGVNEVVDMKIVVVPSTAITVAA